MKEADKFYESPVHDYPIVEIETQSWEKVFMTKYDWVMARNSIYVHNLVRKISSTKQVIDKKYKWVTFPMVDFEDKWDITELLWWRLETQNGYENIAEAKYFHRFRMNEVWAHAEAAAAVSLSRWISFTEVLNIDWPFLVWIETEDWTTPFAAKIWVNDMKNPGDIGEKTEQTQETTAQTTNSNSTETNSQEKLEETELVQEDSSEQTEKTEQTNEQENTSIPMKYSENIKKADNWAKINNWIVNDLKLIKEETWIKSLQNMSVEDIKKLLEEFRQDFKFRNMKDKNPKWIQVTLWVQTALSRLWYNAGKIDGFYWKNTVKAVKEFQKNNNLKADWISWSDTINKIIQLLDKRPS